LDVAEAVDPECKQNIVGIRPGEKLHEEMITQSDAFNTIEYEDYYVIVPSIRIWSKQKFLNKSNFRKGRLCEEGFSYNSNTNQHFLNVNELKKLIEENVTL
jgi:FlaA1/EpsC-like NDP-sugar epimerase